MFTISNYVRKIRAQIFRIKFLIKVGGILFKWKESYAMLLKWLEKVSQFKIPISPSILLVKLILCL